MELELNPERCLELELVQKPELEPELELEQELEEDLEQHPQVVLNPEPKPESREEEGVQDSGQENSLEQEDRCLVTEIRQSVTFTTLVITSSIYSVKETKST